MTQTEELDRLLEPILIKVYEMAIHSQGNYSVRNATLVWAKEEARKACKESKLVFTDYSTDGEGNIILQGLEEIE